MTIKCLNAAKKCTCGDLDRLKAARTALATHRRGDTNKMPISGKKDLIEAKKVLGL